MKKIYALLFALVMVFAIAGIASADTQPLVVNGSFSANANFELGSGDMGFWLLDGSYFGDIIFHKEFGKAVADLDLIFDGGLYPRTFSYMYNFSEGFGLGVVFNDDEDGDDGVLAYAAPIIGWSFYVPGEFTGWRPSEEAIKATFKIGAVSGELYTNGGFTDDPGYAAHVKAELGICTLNVGGDYDPWSPYKMAEVGADASFKVTDKVTIGVAGGYWYEFDWTDTDWIVGAKAAYKGDALSADGWVTYEQYLEDGILDDEWLYVGADITATVVPDMVTLFAGFSFDVLGASLAAFEVRADVVFTENISAFALYQGGQFDDDYTDGFWIEGDFKIDGTNTLAVWYESDDNEIGACLTVNF